MFMGAVAGLSTGCTDFEKISTGWRSPEKWGNPLEEWIPSICQQCIGGCGLLVRVIEGRAVKVVGNPLHPVSGGGICAKGLASIQSLYDPDRIQTPLKRSGDRGEGKWQPIGWDEATAMVVERLRGLQEKKLTNSLVILAGQFHDLREPLLHRFTDAYGTPNYIRNRCFTPDEASKAHFLMQGVASPLGYDLMNASLILSFGCSLLEAWISPVFQLRAFGHIRQERPGNRGRIYVVDPRFSVSASKADQWIPIRLGTDAALALGMAYVIIQEGIYDRKFVERNTFGFEDWTDGGGKSHVGFKTLVLNEYKPFKVSGITGVPVEDIFSLARAFVNRRPAIALGEKGLSYRPNDIYTRMAIHSLNGLSGSLGSKGCLTVQSDVPLTAWPAPEQEESVRFGNSQPRSMAQARGNTFWPRMRWRTSLETSWQVVLIPWRHSFSFIQIPSSLIPKGRHSSRPSRKFLLSSVSPHSWTRHRSMRISSCLIIRSWNGGRGVRSVIAPDLAFSALEGLLWNPYTPRGTRRIS
jgi:anaerobic selenocysteine-containing dehydrogenase